MYVAYEVYTPAFCFDTHNARHCADLACEHAYCASLLNISEEHELLLVWLEDPNSFQLPEYINLPDHLDSGS